MRFANLPIPRAGCAATLGLAAVLIFVFQTSEAINVPTVLRLNTERTALSVKDCLESPQGKHLLGELSRVPVMSGGRLNRGDRLYSTSKGHLILFHKEGWETVLRVKNTGKLNESQLRFLSGCSDRLGKW